MIWIDVILCLVKAMGVNMHDSPLLTEKTNKIGSAKSEGDLEFVGVSPAI